jgi:adenylyltransferase/sulfurtransferase
VLEQGEPLIGRLLMYESLQMKFRTLKLRRDPNCPVCGEKPTITKYVDYEGFCSR